MTCFIYCVVDTRVGEYRNIFQSENNEMAIRHFSAICSMDGSQQNLFPDDFYLCCLGSFDTITGKFENDPAPKPFYTGTQWKQERCAQIKHLQEDTLFMERITNALQLVGGLPDASHVSASEANKGNAVSSLSDKAQAASQNCEECTAQAGESEEEN